MSNTSKCFSWQLAQVIATKDRNVPLQTPISCNSHLIQFSHHQILFQTMVKCHFMHSFAQFQFNLDISNWKCLNIHISLCSITFQVHNWYLSRDTMDKPHEWFQKALLKHWISPPALLSSVSVMACRILFHFHRPFLNIPGQLHFSEIYCDTLIQLNTHTILHSIQIV